MSNSRTGCLKANRFPERSKIIFATLPSAVRHATVNSGGAGGESHSPPAPLNLFVGKAVALHMYAAKISVEIVSDGVLLWLKNHRFRYAGRR